MINASLKIFGLNGYQHASTDDIVKEASISKGLLFHYFNSKLGLYTFLADYCVRFMILEISTGVNSGVNGKETDYFKLLMELESAKLKVLKNYPYMQHFINSIEQETDEEALSVTKEQRDNLAAVYHEIMSRADTSRFLPEADATRVGKMIRMTLSGLMSESIKKGVFQPERFYTEAQKYLHMIGSISYK